MVIEQCKDCGSTRLSWTSHKTSVYGPQDGMLKMHDITIQFILGCDECYATLRMVPDDKMMNFINELRNKNIEIDL